MLSATMRTGEYFAMPGSRQVSSRIVGQRRANADHDGVALRSQEMDAVAHLMPGDRQRLAAGGAGLAVCRNRELEHDMGPAVAHAPDMAGMIAARLVGADADLDRNAGRAQPRMTRARDFRIGVFQRRDDARHPAAMTASAQGGDFP